MEALVVFFALIAVAFCILWIDTLWRRDYWKDSAGYWRAAYDKARGQTDAALDTAEKAIQMANPVDMKRMIYGAGTRFPKFPEQTS